MILGPVRVMGAGVVVRAHVEEVSVVYIYYQCIVCLNVVLLLKVCKCVNLSLHK